MHKPKYVLRADAQLLHNASSRLRCASCGARMCIFPLVLMTYSSIDDTVLQDGYTPLHWAKSRLAVGGAAGGGGGSPGGTDIRGRAAAFAAHAAGTHTSIVSTSHVH